MISLRNRWSRRIQRQTSWRDERPYPLSLSDTQKKVFTNLHFVTIMGSCAKKGRLSVTTLSLFLSIKGENKLGYLGRNVIELENFRRKTSSKDLRTHYNHLGYVKICSHEINCPDTRQYWKSILFIYLFFARNFKLLNIIIFFREKLN